jgi:hypothetical protein
MVVMDDMDGHGGGYSPFPHCPFPALPFPA